MRLRNTSKYPLVEVRSLVEAGFRAAGCGSVRVAVHVKNCSGAYAGMAYRGVPSMSSAHGAADYLVTLRVGAPHKFPVDNMVTTVRWVGPWMTHEERLSAPVPDGTARMRMRSIRGVQSFQYGVESRHPYGGKRSPHIVVRNWREALVAIAAHEARHIRQFKRRKPASEVDCERAAARAVETLRSQP